MAADSDDRFDLLRDGTNFHLHKSCLHIMQVVSVTLCMTFAKDNFGSALSAPLLMLQEEFSLQKITARVRSITDQYLKDVTKLNKTRGELVVVNASLSKSQEVVGKNKHLLPISWLPQFAVLWRSLVALLSLRLQGWFNCFS